MTAGAAPVPQPIVAGRRAVLCGLLATAAFPASSRASGKAGNDRRLAAVLDRSVQHRLDGSPELTTRLGLDTGDRAGARRHLDDRSLGAAVARKSDVRTELGWLAAIDPRSLSQKEAIDLAAIKFTLETEDEIGRGFRYGAAVDPQPYVVSHLTGAYLSVPDFLDSKHEVQTRADADAYLARLDDFADVVAEETARLEHDAALGAVPPDFVQDRTLSQLRALRDQPASQSSLVTSLVRKAGEAHLEGDYGARAARILDQRIRPALALQAAALESLRPRAPAAAGIWRLPDGERYYAAALRSCTTRKVTPAALHEEGKTLTAQLAATLDGLLRGQGLTTGSLADRIGVLRADPKLLYPNTDSGRAQFIADMSVRVNALRVRLPMDFRTIPKTPVEIRRVPPVREAAAPPAYYEDPSIDGSRPGTFYINLQDTRQTPLWMMTSTVFHETIPGHHLQQAMLLEGPPMPLIRKIFWPEAYGEGWAVYAEQLAEELGIYDRDPLGRIGYVLSTMLRACRLVVDTGINAHRWTRDQAIAWLIEHGGIPKPIAVNEVERYCVWPGQACSYMVGKMAWLQLRARPAIARLQI